MTMTKTQREELKHLKSEAGSAKSRLIDLVRKVEAISPSQAEQLSKISARLEDWQNK
jgi:hypothetical protein